MCTDPLTDKQPRIALHVFMDTAMVTRDVSDTSQASLSADPETNLVLEV